jgi:hypothetical protein
MGRGRGRGRGGGFSEREDQYGGFGSQDRDQHQFAGGRHGAGGGGGAGGSQASGRRQQRRQRPPAGACMCDSWKAPGTQRPPVLLNVPRRHGTKAAI